MTKSRHEEGTQSIPIHTFILLICAGFCGEKVGKRYLSVKCNADVELALESVLTFDLSVLNLCPLDVDLVQPS